jgi:hypothetical protein
LAEDNNGGRRPTTFTIHQPFGVSHLRRHLSTDWSVKIAPYLRQTTGSQRRLDARRQQWVAEVLPFPCPTVEDGILLKKQRTFLCDVL